MGGRSAVADSAEGESEVTFLARCAWALSLVATVIARGQNPDAALGARLYRLHCSECHGMDGRGGVGTDLTRGVYRFGSTDEALYRTISKGVAGTMMPATSLPDSGLWQIVRHVRVLGGGVRVTVAGNPATGEALFSARGCAKCHMIRGAGGRLGPDLTYIGSLRSPSHLRASLTRPDEEVSRAYWSVEAVDNQARTYSGICMGEDTYSIQILDLNEELHSVYKQDLKRLVVEPKSRMPAFGQTLTGAELDDLVSYLYSLERRGRRP
jgi:putative heme-binding domain-containing protein